MFEIKDTCYDTVSVSTQGIHGDAHLRTSADVVPPISVTTTFDYPKDDLGSCNYGPDQSYAYSRETTPIVTKVEATLSTLTEGYAVLYGSGLSAALAVLIEYKPRKIALSKCYFGVGEVVSQYQELVPGVEVVDTDGSFDGVDLVWIESPVNPTGEVLDICSYTQRAHAAGAILVIDSTLAPPPLSYPFRQGADIVVHSATKYLGGHCDLLAGVVVTKSAKSTETLRKTRGVLGLGAGSMEAWLLLRSLRTLSVRVRQQSQTTAQLVGFLEGHRSAACATAEHAPAEAELSVGRRIAKVQHASLQFPAESRSPDVTRQHPEGFGALFAVLFATKEQALFVARHLKLHRFATSLGGVESLVDWRHGFDPTADPTMLRVSVGLESYEDLANDWKQALLALDAHETEAPVIS
ncbi:hypothetical protein IW140_003306 [Coemansia sp. RSA 1813]|nr:hypothetical protein EV178_002925 [Coemansia sp. RSA 1646]KAJ1771714.1 hypothetical protein LPJ74_002141 [Coemansia sp. RSA 1843]KAJ2089649.1 hypothetical protein IW138_003247 [Coemansia sp. RSA 986]KAJ2210333.1 hypothetical protein EV179_006311 [Coemansia sp. RSA 487]KAJ2569214.1 hypothetical protein IW140_003306 [Coemansia sp. RSA 1813]